MRQRLNLVGASSGRPSIIEHNGVRRPVMTSGFNEARGVPGKTWCVSSVFQKLDFKDEIDLIWNIHKNVEALEPWLMSELHRVILCFDINGSHRLEWERMADQYGPVFGSSLAWMLCCAIELEYEEIFLYGFDLATQPEYIEQRDTAFYWIGRAEALGIKVNIPEKSRMFFKDRIYGVL